MTIVARLHAFDGDPVLEELDLSEPAPGEALVALAAATVAHIDLTVASGTFAFRPELPWTPGTEGAGRVVASAHFAAGTPVRVRGARVGLDRDGTWAQAAVVPDAALTEVPPDVAPTLAAAFFSPALTAHAAVYELAQVSSGERVGVVGAAGAVGTLAVQLALEAGAEVVGVVRSAKVATLPPGVEAVSDLAEAEPVEVLIDTVGGDGLAARVTRSVVPGGRAVLVGYTAGTTVSFDLPALMAADVRLLPMNLIRWAPRLTGAAGELLGRLARGELELPLTVLGLERVGEAVKHVREGTANGRVVITMEGLDGRGG